MRARDSDLVLVEEMLAPPPLDDARRSLEYWERRRRALPLHRRRARREARDMVVRWQARVAAARQARFDMSPVGRFLAALGISTAWFGRLSTRNAALVAWTIVPPKVKLVAAGVLAAWLVVAVGVFALFAALFAQLL
jgi:hypothetical protein